MVAWLLLAASFSVAVGQGSTALDVYAINEDGDRIPVTESFAVENLVESKNNTINFEAVSSLGIELDGCVLFNVTGNDFVYAYSDCTPPFRAFLCDDSKVPPGDYTVTAKLCFPECIGVETVQPYFVSYEFGVEEIFLFDETEKAELEFRDTFPIPSVQLFEGHFYNIRTTVYGGVESVAVSVAINDFIEARIENFVQYDAFIPGGRLLPPGNYTVMSQPFSENRAQGEAGGPVSFTFEAFY